MTRRSAATSSPPTTSRPVRRPSASCARLLSLLRATLDSTADGIIVVDLEGNIISLNDRMADMWLLPDTFWDNQLNEDVARPRCSTSCPIPKSSWPRSKSSAPTP